jgi:hypothetical protein
VVLPDDGVFDLYVVPHAGANLDEVGLSAAVARAFGVTPRRVRFGARRLIIRNASGKIVRSAARLRVAEGLTTGRSTGPEAGC